ncbi:uncharacterized protein LOC128867733 [Anastrepha ludens]|uniref:uncharacterized protein LOC128867733 n=1 Tax=Anastrepha ludens TaxID=28586 RepID=UPI0023AF5067|nr:uncharacterized protein LOC128867733 [Anastrepha ludens]
MYNIYKKASTTTTSWISRSSSGSEMTASKRRVAGGVSTGLISSHATSGSRKFLLAVACLFVLLASANCAADQMLVNNVVR